LWKIKKGINNIVKNGKEKKKKKKRVAEMRRPKAVLSQRPIIQRRQTKKQGHIL